MAARKKFIDVELPLINEMTSITGTLESAKGKIIKLDMTRKLRGKSLEIKFKIIEQNEKLIGLPKKMELMKFYIVRMMRKRTNYVEDSFQIETKDIEATIKPFLITRKKVSHAVRRNLRNTAKDFLINYAKERPYIHVCEDILLGTLQKQMLPKLKKVYPLSFCEIRVFEAKDINKLELPKEEIKEEEPKTEEKESETKEEKEATKPKKEKVESEEKIEEDTKPSQTEESKKETKTSKKKEE